MSTEENKALYRRWITHDLGANDVEQFTNELFASDFLDHFAPPGTPAGPEGVRQMLKASSRPDTKATIEHLIAEGDQVWARVVVRNTPQGNLYLADMVRIANGKIAEHWAIVQPLP